MNLINKFFYANKIYYYVRGGTFIVFHTKSALKSGENNLESCMYMLLV